MRCVDDGVGKAEELRNLGVGNRLAERDAIAGDPLELTAMRMVNCGPWIVSVASGSSSSARMTVSQPLTGA